MFLEDGLSNSAPATQESGNNHNKLQSLNGVLGKNLPPSKASKNAPGNAFFTMQSVQFFSIFSYKVMTRFKFGCFRTS